MSPACWPSGARTRAPGESTDSAMGTTRRSRLRTRADLALTMQRAPCPNTGSADLPHQGPKTTVGRLRPLSSNKTSWAKPSPVLRRKIQGHSTKTETKAAPQYPGAGGDVQCPDGRMWPQYGEKMAVSGWDTSCLTGLWLCPTQRSAGEYRKIPFRKSVTKIFSQVKLALRFHWHGIVACPP